MNHKFRPSLLVFGFAALASTARPTFLIDPTGGTSLSGFASAGTADPDDGSLLRPLGGAFSIYGASVTSLYLQADGFLSSADGYGFYADRGVGALSGLVLGSVIAPFYDDLYFDTTLGDTVTEKKGATYYSATYAISGQADITTGHQTTFQTALFNAPTVFQGNSFQAGDIVLSYGAFNSTIGGTTFSVGVASSAANATGAFGTDGQFATSSAFTTGHFNPATQALLFRFVPGTQGYAQSVITYQAVPEPGTLAALGLVGAAALRRRRR